MFEKAADAFSGKTSLEVIERLDEYRLVFGAADIAPQTALTQILKLLTLLKDVRSRDRFELQISFDGDALSVTDSSDAVQALVAAHLQAHQQHGEARYELVVKKGLDTSLSVYCLSAFGKYLEGEPLAVVLSALATRFKDGLVFECMFPVIACGSDTLRFCPKGDVSSCPGATHAERLQVLTSFRDNSYSAGIKGEFLPSDFHLLERSAEPTINTFMDRACSVLCAIYLSNSSEIHTAERLSYKLIGYKSVEGDAPFIDFVPALAGLYKIYDWAYGVGGSADRIGLARNVVSLHVDRLQDVSDNSSLWNAIHSNYQIYLKGNVASYLEVKNKIAEFLVESTSRAHALVEGLVDSLKNGVFVMLTFLLTVVVVNGLKDTGAAIIFSATYFWIVTLLCAVLTVWVVGACRGAIRRFDNSAQTTSSVLKLAYGRILLSNEIEENIDPINDKNRTYLVKQCWRYAIYWFLIVVILVGGFGLGYLSFGRAQVAPPVDTKQAEDVRGVGPVKPARTPARSTTPSPSLPNDPSHVTPVAADPKAPEGAASESRATNQH